METKNPVVLTKEQMVQKVIMEKTAKAKANGNLFCFKCGRYTGVWRITLKKVADGKYVCQTCA